MLDGGSGSSPKNYIKKLLFLEPTGIPPISSPPPCPRKHGSPSLLLLTLPLPAMYTYSTLQYTSDHLHDIKSSMPTQRFKLPRMVFDHIKSLSIFKWHHRHRGFRGGKRKVIDTRTLMPQNIIADRLSNDDMTHLGLTNCQSACNKPDLIKDHINDHNIVILALTETWFRSEQNKHTNDVTPRGFKLVHMPRKGRRGGGVALLYKSSLSASV